MKVRIEVEVNKSQQVGGFAAFVLAATFIVGFALYIGLLLDSGFESSDPAEATAFLVDHQAILIVWHIIIYLVFGIALVVLSLALYERLRTVASSIARTATAFGLIWAVLVLASGMIAVVGIEAVVDLYHTDPDRAGTVWMTIKTVQFAIGGGIELVGALWVLLVSMAALRTGDLSRRLNYLGVGIGVAGVLTIVPALELFGAVFGFGLILWFAWVGILMLRSAPERHVSQESASIDPRFA
jgi:hypothetical protein